MKKRNKSKPTAELDNLPSALRDFAFKKAQVDSAEIKNQNKEENSDIDHIGLCRRQDEKILAKRKAEEEKELKRKNDEKKSIKKSDTKFNKKKESSSKKV